MPITIIDSAEDIAPTPDFSGSINRAMGAFTASIKDAVSYPLTYTARGGALNLYQTGTAAEDDRKAIGLMDACHIVGFNSGAQADTTPPTSGYVSRVDGNKEILAANPGGVHYLFTYFVFTEAQDSDTEKVVKIESENGPNGDDWWAYNSSGDRVLLFADAYTINFSDYSSVDANGDTWPEWHADNYVQPKYIDPHVAGGVKIGGPGGVNFFLDNLQLHANKSGVDYNNTGGNDDAQEYYDVEEDDHITNDPVAVNAYVAIRANMMKGVNRVRSNNPGILTLANTNQWADKPDNRLDKPESFGELRNVIREYRLGTATDQADIEGGFSEGNSGNSTFRSGIYSDGSLAPSGNWLQTYFNTLQSTRFVQAPAIVPCSFWVQCLQSGSTGPGGKSIWSPIPASNAYWNVARWAMCTAWMAGAHATLSGIQVGASTAGRAQSTPIFDEYGLINGSTDYGFGSGSTKLYYKWMGSPIEDPPIVAKADGSWQRWFQNCGIILNPSRTSSITVDVSEFPFACTRFNGSQDPTTNDGTPASSDFTLNAIDAIVLPKKSFYDAL